MEPEDHEETRINPNIRQASIIDIIHRIAGQRQANAIDIT